MEELTAEYGDFQEPEEEASPEAKRRALQEKQRKSLENARARSRVARWTAKGKSRVTHPAHGSVIVPHLSKLGAIENAAEFWKCDVLDIIREAESIAVEEDAGPVRRPREFYRKVNRTEQGVQGEDLKRASRRRKEKNA